ncbi:oxidoreductase [Luteimonas aestuarii]|uniref:Oxidoreductase n=1 Tax=Luteimonas aestuarii TaxID=453837 RepID=A0A4R5U0P3_9GAMM|nr:oxidoreductase [Luteimonas aestuarii]TDK27140.1 oxidoreductase [Luteimonas aestuarii]
MRATAPLNVALVGYGYVGKVFHAPLIAHTHGLHLHTVVSGDATKVHADIPEVRVAADPRSAFDDDAIDLVVIAAPNAVHARLALAALQAGRHVVVDKPFTTTLAEARQVVDAATRNGRIASVFHNRRWDGDFLTLRKLVEDGTLGEVVELHSHFDRFRPQVPDRWRERAGAGAGLWFDLGPHLVDQSLQLFGTPEAVQADIAMQRDGAVVDDWFHVVLRYPRLRVVLHAGALVAAPGPRFVAHGTRGSFVKHGLDTQEAMLRQGIVPGAPGWGVDPAPGTLTHVDDGVAHASRVETIAGDYRAFYARMRDALLGHAPPPVTATEALAVMRILELGATSAREGRAMPLD